MWGRRPRSDGSLPAVPQVGRRGRNLRRPGKLAGAGGAALSRVRLPAPGSRLPAPGTPCPARSRFSKDAQPRRGGVRTREAVSSDPPAVRSPAEPGSCRDGAAAPAWSPAPCRIRLREGGRGGRAGLRRGSAGLRIAAEGRLEAGQDPRPSRAGEGGQRGRRCLRPWGGRVG